MPFFGQHQTLPWFSRLGPVSDFNYTVTVDVDYPEYLQTFNKNVLFLPEKIVTNKEKKIPWHTFLNKRNYSSHTRLSPQALKH